MYGIMVEAMLVSPELNTHGFYASLYKLVGKSNLLIEKIVFLQSTPK
jgi:hypothetical protein